MAVFSEHELHGRRVILSSVDEINSDNIIDVLQKAMLVHLQNKADIDYLYNYYKGDQPILRRVKEIRPDIVNNIVVNRANEIVSFKVGYQFGIPMQYTASRMVDNIPKDIEKLNSLMSYENKAKKDKDLGEWQMICGTGYRIVLPDDVVSDEEDEAPFELNVLEPNSTFVIYSSKIGRKPLAGVTFWKDDDFTGSADSKVAPLGGYVIAVYTPKWYYEIKAGKISIEPKANTLGMIPIVEYPLNNARLGAFEVVVDILNAISEVESNRLDGLEQFIQSFIKFINCDMDEEEYDRFLEKGAIKVYSHEGANADVDMISSELSQTETQTYIDDLYNTVLTICGVPSQGNANTSDSSNNGAMIVKNGWSSAEGRAKDAEVMFEASEREALKIVLKILRDKNVLNLKVSDVEMKFPRRNYEDIQSKVQALVSMLGNEKIHPKDAYAHCGLFTDPETAYENGIEWYTKQMSEWNVEDVGDEDKNDVSRSGQTIDGDTERP